MMDSLRPLSYIPLLAVVCAVSASACGHSARQSPPVQEVTLVPDEQLGIDDVFDVRVAGEADMTGSFRVAADGTVDFPYVGRLTVIGKRSGDVQREISEKLRDEKILVSPQVSVMVKEWNSRKVLVLGQVNKPGSVSYFPRMTIVDAIAAAGDFSPIAAKNNVTLRRDVKGQTVTRVYPVRDISEGRAGNVYLLPGDMLVVDERLF